MYRPPAFQIDEQQSLNFAEQQGFGQLVSYHQQQLVASPLPFVLQNEGRELITHMAKKNPQWQHLEQQELLFTVQGPHGYVSPTWYQGPGVPTWNYQLVHLYGRAELVTEATPLAKLVQLMSQHFEADQATPWDQDYPEAMLKHIIGIRLRIERVEGKFKLSQNRPEADQQSVAEQLGGELGRQMKRP